MTSMPETGTGNPGDNPTTQVAPAVSNNLAGIAPKKPKKKLLILIVAVVAILLLILVLFWARRNNQQRTTAGTSLITPGNTPESSKENNPVATLAPANNNFIGLTHGSLAAGQSTSVDINLSGGQETHFYLSWVGSRPEFTLTKPDGTVIDEEYVLGNLKEVNLESSDTPPRLIYIVYSPKAGTWKMNISAGSQIDYQVFASLADSPASNGNDSVPAANVPVLPTATPQLAQNGAKKVVLTGRVRERRVDRDGNGFYEYLTLFYEIDSSNFVDAEFKTVLGSGSEIIAETIDKIKLKKGLQEIPVIYYGYNFLESELNGPYVVSEALLIPAAPGFPEEKKENVFTTSGYQYSEFESIGTEL